MKEWAHEFREAARSCPVCGADDARDYLRKRGLQLVTCGRCSMVYVNPAPFEFASGRYYDGASVDYYLSPAKLESDYAPVRFQRELRIFRKHCPGGVVLDVGCSTGAFLFHLNQRFPGCYEVFGTDVSGAPLDYAESRGVRVIRGSFTEHEFGETKFNSVTFWAVLEHLLEPGRFLDKALSILTPRGLCFVLVPNLKSFAARLLGARYRYIYQQHLNYFTRATLKRLVEPAFSILEFRSTHFNPLVIWQDWHLGGKDVSNRERARLLQKTTAYKQNPLLKPIKVMYRLTEGLLGGVGLADNLVVVLRKRD